MLKHVGKTPDNLGCILTNMILPGMHEPARSRAHRAACMRLDLLIPVRRSTGSLAGEGRRRIVVGVCANQPVSTGEIGR